MPTVSNTSPLLNLAIIGEVDLLRTQFGELLTVTGILGVCFARVLRERLASLRDAITALRDEAGFWIAPALEAEILRAGGEG